MPKFSKTSKKELLSITSDKISEQQHCQQRITEAGNFDSKPMDKEIQHLDTEIAITGPDQPGSDTYFYHYYWTTLMDDFCAS